MNKMKFATALNRVSTMDQFAHASDPYLDFERYVVTMPDRHDDDYYGWRLSVWIEDGHPVVRQREILPNIGFATEREEGIEAGWHFDMPVPEPYYSQCQADMEKCIEQIERELGFIVIPKEEESQ